MLYNLFSFYGDVERVKILRKKNNCALVEFSTATFACIARDHLDQSTIRGERLVVTFSRFDRVRMPQEIGLPPDDNTQDFSGMEHQKFKRFVVFRLFACVEIHHFVQVLDRGVEEEQYEEDHRPHLHHTR